MGALKGITIFCGCACGGIEATPEEAAELEKNGCPVCRARKQNLDKLIETELKARIVADELKTLRLSPAEQEKKRQMLDAYAAEYLTLKAERAELKQIGKLADIKPRAAK